MIPFLLSLILATPQATPWPPIHAAPHYHSGNVGIPLKRPDLYDGLMVATVLGPAVPRAIPGKFAVQPVRVEDSRAFAPGTLVDVYFQTLPQPGMLSDPWPGLAGIEPRDVMPVGARVLVIGTAAQNGSLRIPDLSEFDPPAPFLVSLGPNPKPSMFEVEYFQTTRGGLAPVADPEWRLLGSIAAAIPGTPDANVVRIADLIHTFEGREPPSVLGKPDDRLSKLFSDATAKDTPYHRALVDYALNELQYWGYGDRFRRDLRAAADDPDAFPDGIPSLQFEESPGTGNNNLLPKDFRHDPPLSQSEILALALRARSPAIAEGLLHGLSDKPADADVKALAARFLDFPDPRARRAMVERLVAWNGLPAPEPLAEKVNAEGNWHFVAPPGLDAAVAFWKRKLGLP